MAQRAKVFTPFERVQEIVRRADRKEPVGMHTAAELTRGAMRAVQRMLERYDRPGEDQKLELILRGLSDRSAREIAAFYYVGRGDYADFREAVDNVSAHPLDLVGKRNFARCVAAGYNKTAAH